MTRRQVRLRCGVWEDEEQVGLAVFFLRELSLEYPEALAALCRLVFDGEAPDVTEAAVLRRKRYNFLTDDGRPWDDVADVVRSLAVRRGGRFELLQSPLHDGGGDV